MINAKEEGYSVMLETTHFELEYSKQSSCDDADYVDVRDGKKNIIVISSGCVNWY